MTNGTNIPKEEEKRLLEQLSNGSELAFTRIFDHYRPRVYSVALKMLKSTDLAEEVVQEVFLKIWQKRAELAEIRSLEDYLFMMARNDIYDRFRKWAGDRAFKESFSRHKNGIVSDTDKSVIEKEYSRMLEETLDLLPPRQIQIYRLSREEGMSYKEIGNKLDISHHTVKKHMAQALKFIRERLENDIEFSAFLPLLLTLFQ